MIHGSLRSFNLLEVLQFVGRKSGVLIVSSPEGEVEVYLESGNMVGFVYRGERVKDIFRIRGIIYRFLRLSEGRFEYVPGDVNIRDFSVPVEVFILSVVSMGDELQDLRMSSLVHPDTVYVLSGEVEDMGGDIGEFLRTAVPLLREGSSARKISEEMGLDLDMVRKFMTVIEAAGVLRPLPRSRVREDVPLLNRVMGLLRRMWGWRR